LCTQLALRPLTLWNLTDSDVQFAAAAPWLDLAVTNKIYYKTMVTAMLLRNIFG
jgi:hypothetical protein